MFWKRRQPHQLEFLFFVSSPFLFFSLCVCIWFLVVVFFLFSSVSVCCSSAQYREKERVCLPPPFHVWLSWGSSYRCPNQSSACVVLSDVVELAELAELCCCGDEVISFLDFFLPSTGPLLCFYSLPFFVLFLFVCFFQLETSFVRSLFHIHLTLLSVELLFIRPLCSGRSFRPFFSVSFGVLFVSSTTLRGSKRDSEKEKRDPSCRKVRRNALQRTQSSSSIVCRPR